MEYALTATNLSKSYGAQRVLLACSLHVPERSIYGLIGGKEAGKTTLLRVVCGLQQPTTGIYTLYGARSGTAAIHKARRRLGAIVESPAVIGDLSAADNLRACGRLRGIQDEQLIRETLRLVGLSAAGTKKVRSFSRGMRQRLGVGCALLGSPDLLILDEPGRGLDEQNVLEMRELILRLHQDRGITFLISCRASDELSRIATWYGFLSHGRIVQESSAQALRCGQPLGAGMLHAPAAASMDGQGRSNLPCQADSSTELRFGRDLHRNSTQPGCFCGLSGESGNRLHPAGGDIQ